MNIHALPFLLSSIYLSFIVSLCMTVLESGFDGRLAAKALWRWGKFLLLLVGLGIVIQIISLFT